MVAWRDNIVKLGQLYLLNTFLCLGCPGTFRVPGSSAWVNTSILTGMGDKRRWKSQAHQTRATNIQLFSIREEVTLVVSISRDEQSKFCCKFPIFTYQYSLLPKSWCVCVRALHVQVSKTVFQFIRSRYSRLIFEKGKV